MPDKQIHNDGYFSNMLGYELVLLIMGIVLFIVVLGGFIYLLKKGRLKPTYAIFLIIPIIMIGYPSIVTLNVMNGLISLERYTADLAQNPDNIKAKIQVEKLVEELENKPVRSPRQQNALIEANLTLGNLEKADQEIRKIKESEKFDEQAKINEDRLKILKASKKIESNPSTFIMTDDLIKSISHLKSYPYINHFDTMSINIIENVSK